MRRSPTQELNAYVVRISNQSIRQVAAWLYMTAVTRLVCRRFRDPLEDSWDRT